MWLGGDGKLYDEAMMQATGTKATTVFVKSGNYPIGNTPPGNENGHQRF